VVDLTAGPAPEFDNDNLVANIDVLLLGDAGTGVEGVLVENFHGLEDLRVGSRVHGVGGSLLIQRVLMSLLTHRGCWYSSDISGILSRGSGGAGRVGVGHGDVLWLQKRLGAP
jgi:hypothetical protein